MMIFLAMHRFLRIALFTTVLLAFSAVIYYKFYNYNRDLQTAEQQLSIQQELNTLLINKLDQLFEDSPDFKQLFFQSDSVELDSAGYASLHKALKRMAEFRDAYDLQASEIVSFRTQTRVQTEQINKHEERIRHLTNHLTQRDDSMMVLDDLLAQRSLQVEYLTLQNDQLTDKLEDLAVEYDRVVSSYGRLEFETDNQTVVDFFGRIDDEKPVYGVGFFANGGHYIGEWKNFQRHGQGQHYWKNGDYYIGEFVHNVREGEGTYFFVSGEKYKGQWVSDLREGYGVLKDKKDSTLVEGTWSNNKLLSR